MSPAERRPGDVEGAQFPWPRSMSGQPAQPESNFGDSSEALFSIYSKVTEREDGKMAKRWQKDARMILIFVSPQSPFTRLHTSTEKKSRPVYSLSSSRYWSPCLLRTSGQSRKTPPHSISRTSTKFSPSLMYLPYHPLPHWHNHPRSFHQHMPSGSTHSGS